MNNKLSNEDIATLSKGLDLILKENANRLITNGLFSIILSKSQEDAEKKLGKSQEAFEKNEQSRSVLEEKIILIKAKLIKMKDTNEVNSLINQ